MTPAKSVILLQDPVFRPLFSPDPPGWYAFINYCLSFPLSFILNNYLFIYDSSQIINSPPHLNKTSLGNFFYLWDFTWPPTADWLLSLLVYLLLLFWFFIGLGYCYEIWNLFFLLHFHLLLQFTSFESWQFFSHLNYYRTYKWHLLWVAKATHQA